MEGYGYEVVTSEGDVIGHVVGRAGENFVVEHGRLHRVHHALPLAYADVDEEAHKVRTTLSKQMIEESPRLKDADDPTDREIAVYYGLASGFAQPDTKGEGVVNPDDPALGAEQQAFRSGVRGGQRGRAYMRDHMEPGTGALGGPPRPIIHPDSNHPAS
jgi:hypothetical protein